MYYLSYSLKGNIFYLYTLFIKVKLKIELMAVSFQLIYLLYNGSLNINNKNALTK